MWFGLFLVFVAVPLLELALLIKLGQWIGFWPTLMIVVGTAGLGTFILHRQGFAAFRRGMANLSAGTPPVEPILDASMLMGAGALLLAPGLLTDCLGFLLLVPPIRRAVGVWGLRRMLAAGSIHVSTYSNTDRSPPEQQRRTGAPPNPGRQPSARGPVIDGEFERLDEKSQKPKPDHDTKPINPPQKRGPEA